MPSDVAPKKSSTSVVFDAEGVTTVRTSKAPDWRYLRELFRHHGRKTAYGAWIVDRKSSSEQDYSLRALTVFKFAYFTISRTLHDPKARSVLTKRGTHARSPIELHGGVTLYPVEGEQQPGRLAPGVYVPLTDFSREIVPRLWLPSLPDYVSSLSSVVCVAEPSQKELRRTMEAWWTFLSKSPAEIGAVSKDESVTDAEAVSLSRDTKEWRDQFFADNLCWTAKELAEQSGSRAKNLSSVAHRLQTHGKIFSVRRHSEQVFPRFQFQDGEPLPVVAEVIKAMPQATGWDLAYFFTTPNANIGGRKPTELMRKDPKRLQSLAHAFAAPANVF